MNRSQLIIICNFLLLSLLSLARFEESPSAARPAGTELNAPPSPGQAALLGALQTALEQEKTSHEQLQSQLNQSRTQVKTQEQLLAEREAKLQQARQNLKSTEEQARQLELERVALDQQVVASVRSIVDLEKQLSDATVESKVSQARLDALQSELKMREREAERLQQRMSRVEEQQKTAEYDKQQLALKLQATETEKQLVREQLVATQQQVAQAQQEKQAIQEQSKVLAAGVTTLAGRSDELKQEMRESRALPMNPLFSAVLTNRIDVEFRAGNADQIEAGGSIRATRTILVKGAGQIYAVLHAQDAQIEAAGEPAAWEFLTGSLRRSGASVTLEKLEFLSADPRILLGPVSVEQAVALGVPVYSLAKEPFKLTEAVLVGCAGAYYGEASFQMDAATPKHIWLPRERFVKLVGKFAPARGDLVFNKSGELLGVMANAEYCVVFTDLAIGGVIPLGPAFKSAASAEVLVGQKARVAQLPKPVQ